MNVYINLPVADLARSRAFFSALGFGINERFSDDTAIAVQFGESNGAMLLTHEKFAPFTPRAIADSRSVTETLIAFLLGSRAEVDATMEKALANGGEEVRPAEDHGFMYGRAFADPDGHIWEPFWMDPKAVEEMG